jgi:hypothetical protein
MFTILYMANKDNNENVIKYIQELAELTDKGKVFKNAYLNYCRANNAIKYRLEKLRRQYDYLEEDQIVQVAKYQWTTDL